MCLAQRHLNIYDVSPHNTPIDPIVVSCRLKYRAAVQETRALKQILDSDLIAQAEYEQLKTSVCTMFLLCFGTRDLNYRHTVLNRRHAPLLYTHPNVCLMESNTGLDHFWLRCGQRQNTRRQDTNASTATKSSRAKATITTSTKSRCLQINATT